MANDIICEISSENELICEMSSAGEIVVEVNGMTYQSVAAELAEKASVEDVALKADKTYVDTQDLLKADKSTTYTKAEVDTQLGLKADKTYVDTQDLLKADKQQEPWITPTLMNGWNAYAITTPVKYMKNTIGIVEIRGSVKTGTTGTIIFNLPIGYRPSQIIEFVVATNSGTSVCTLVIGTDGNVVAYKAYTTWISLSNINFSVS